MYARRKDILTSNVCMCSMYLLTTCAVSLNSSTIWHLPMYVCTHSIIWLFELLQCIPTISCVYVRSYFMSKGLQYVGSPWRSLKGVGGAGDGMFFFMHFTSFSNQATLSILFIRWFIVEKQNFSSTDNTEFTGYSNLQGYLLFLTMHY